MEKIIIIDGNSLLFRAYHATAYPGVEIMRSQDGTPTNAIFAFSNMINKIISSLNKGDHIMVAFDTGKPTFRNEALKTYKANRKPVPNDLVEQFPLSRDFLKAFGIFQFEEEGFEGDDIAGSVAKLAESSSYEVILYTSDRDFLQLVSDKITVCILKKGLSDTLMMTPTLVKEMYGFEPKQIIDYKGLRGDSSDNLPGIPGVGEKTAVKLINEYGSFDNIMAHANEMKGKLKEELINNQKLGTISRDLAIIKTDIDLPFTLEDTLYEGYDFRKINEFCQKYGLKQFLNKMPTKWKKVDENEIELTITKVTTFKDITIDNDIGIALDFDNDQYHTCPIYGIAISSKNNHYYIDFEDAKKDEALLNILKNETINKYCYDYKAMMVALHNYGIILNGLKFDILIASYLLDSSLNNNVDSVMNFFGVDLGKEEINLLENNSIKRTIKLAYYSLNQYHKVKTELVKISSLDLYETLELPLILTLSSMEIEGFPLDKNILDEYGKIYKEKLIEISKDIYELAGTTFNLSSPKQIGDVLFNKLGLPSNKKMSTSFENLKELSPLHPIVNKILEYRKYAKLLSTYVEGLKPHIFPDGKIHATFNQALTSTGRLSSSAPNLQNISIRDEEGKVLRKAFYYPNHEYEILSLDYSQIELRVLAHLSNCPALINIFKNHEDIHTETAKTIFHLNGEPDASMRRKAKAINFGIIYGISDWGLAEQLDCSIKEAKEIITNFYNSFPEVSIFFENIVKEAIKNGYVSTMLGRRRYLRELHDTNYQRREFAKRAAMNAPIQGTAADLIKIAMNKVYKALNEGHYQTKMVLQIHDELIFKVPKNEKEEVYNLIKNIMENSLSLNVPLEVDGGFGVDWYSAK